MVALLLLAPTVGYLLKGAAYGAGRAGVGTGRVLKLACDSANNKDFFCGGRKQRMLESAEKLRKEAEEMAELYPAPIALESSRPHPVLSQTEEGQGGDGEDDDGNVSVVGERGCDGERNKLAKMISGELQRKKRRETEEQVERHNIVDAAEDEARRDLRSSVVASRDSYNRACEFEKRAQFSLVEEELPDVETVYASIEPQWLRFMTRHAARFFVTDDSVPEDKTLVELAVALEMKNFVEGVMQPSPGAMPSSSMFDSDVEAFDKRVRSRVKCMKVGNNASLGGTASMGVESLAGPFVVSGQGGDGSGGGALDTTTSLETIAAVVDRDALDSLEGIVAVGHILRNDAAHLREEDGERANFYGRVEAYVDEVEALDSNMDLLSAGKDGRVASGVMRERMQGMDSVEVDKEGSTGPLNVWDLATKDAKDIAEDDINGVMDVLMGGMEGDGEIRSSSERIIKEYFDIQSRTGGAVINKAGAGRVQNKLLRGLFEVSGVVTVQGAVVFEGTLSPNTNKTCFTEELQTRLHETGLDKDIGIMTVMNEKYPSLDRGMASAAMDVLLGYCPAVIVYPRSWNSTVSAVKNDDFRRLWRSILNGGSIVSSGFFAAGCLGMLGENGILMQGGGIPDTFLALAFAPIAISYVSSLVETIAARSKDIEVDHVTVPTFSVFNFGARSTYLTQPKTRTDLFDTAAIGVSTALVLSLLVTFVGLQITSSAPSAEVITFPEVSISLLTTNTFVQQLLDWKFPGMIDAAGLGQTLHLHWLAIAGAGAFLANTLQLIPIDNNAGSKMSYAVLGKENFTILGLLFGFLKFSLIMPAFFLGEGADDAVNVMTRYKLLVDYTLVSLIAGSNNENQLAVDGLNCVSEGRLIAYAALISLVVFALVPFSHLGTDFTQWVDSSNLYLKDVLQNL